MNLMKRFLNWIMGWVILGVVGLVIALGVSFFSDDDATKSSKQTSISEDKKLIEVRKEYWENGNLKSEIPYKKHYRAGWKKVKTTLTPHGIAKEYYETGVLKKEDPYVDGERIGTVKFYDANGSIEMSVEFKDDKQDGKTTYYYKDGSVMDVEYYKEGNKTEMPSSL